jgi:hypothetical protein
VTRERSFRFGRGRSSTIAQAAFGSPGMPT